MDTFKTFLAILLILCGAARLLAQGALDLQGRVVDEAGSPLAGVAVDLIGLNQGVVTDAAGLYKFHQSTALDPDPSGGEGYIPHIRRGVLKFRVGDKLQRVRVEVLEMRGRRLEKLYDQMASPGHYDIDFKRLVREAAPGMYFVKLTLGETYYVFRGLRYGREGFHSEFTLAPSEQVFLSKKAAAAVDSLHFTLEGYENEVLGLDAFVNQNLPDVVLRRGIPFIRHFTGSGKIFDLMTQDTTFIPMEERVHVLLMPDGYTQEFHDAGNYIEDVEDWMDDVFSLTPLDFYKEAFVIWRVPAVSTNVKGEGTTYFDISLGSWSGDMDYAAAQTWEMLDRFPFAPKHFAGRRARNFVVQFMIAHPDRGHSTGSGRSTSMRHPDDSDKSVGVAIALSQHHEFVHAFSRVSDEYYDRDHGSSDGGSTSNLSRSVNCGDLPWSHLIFGGEFNKVQDQLIGVFGPRDLEVNRYHSEFKCLMNGSHHNSDIFGGSNNLRVDRMCNWCRELTAYRVFYNTLVLRDAGEAWDTWVTRHRKPHYDHFGLHVPEVVPQQNSEGREWWQPCVP